MSIKKRTKNRKPALKSQLHNMHIAYYVVLLCALISYVFVVQADVLANMFYSEDIISIDPVTGEPATEPATTHFLANAQGVYEDTMFYKVTPGVLYKIRDDGSIAYEFSDATSPTIEEVFLNRVKPVSYPDDMLEVGDPENASDQAAYRKIVQPDIYPNIDIELRSQDIVLEKVFAIKPGGNPADIRVQVLGGNDLAIGGMNELIVSDTAAFSPPVAYQLDEDGMEVPVEVTYQIISTDAYGFGLGSYDANRTLYIDPSLVQIATNGVPEAPVIQIDSVDDQYVSLSWNEPVSDTVITEYKIKIMTTLDAACDFTNFENPDDANCRSVTFSATTNTANFTSRTWSGIDYRAERPRDIVVFAKNASGWSPVSNRAALDLGASIGKVEVHYDDNEMNETSEGYAIGIGNGDDTAFSNFTDYGYKGYNVRDTTKDVYTFDATGDMTRASGAPSRIDMSAYGATDVVLGDEENVSVPLGFNTEIYGKDVNRVRISSNGLVYLNNFFLESFLYQTNDNATNYYIYGYDSNEQDLDDYRFWFPTLTWYDKANSVKNSLFNQAFTNVLIAAIWAPLDPSKRADARISYVTVGEAPNRVFIVDYYHIPFQNQPADYYLSAQVQIYENENAVIPPPSGTSPQPPTDLNVSMDAGGDLLATWNAPTDEGSHAVTEYILQYGELGTCDATVYQNPSCQSQTVPAQVGTTQSAILQNPPSGDLHVAVFAKSAYGASSASVPFTYYAPQVDPPAAVNVWVDRVQGDTAYLKWDASSSSDPILEYKIRINTTSDYYCNLDEAQDVRGAHCPSISITSASDPTAFANREAAIDYKTLRPFEMYVFARNSAGWSSLSNPAEYYNPNAPIGRVEVHHPDTSDPCPYSSCMYVSSGITNGDDLADDGIQDRDVSQYYTRDRGTLDTETAKGYYFEDPQSPLPVPHDVKPAIEDMTSATTVTVPTDEGGMVVPLGFETQLYGRTVDRVRLDANGLLYVNNFYVDSFKYAEGGLDSSQWYDKTSTYQIYMRSYVPTRMYQYQNLPTLFAQCLVSGCSTVGSLATHVFSNIIVAGKWTNLFPARNHAGQYTPRISYKTVGAAPNRVFVAEYQDIPYSDWYGYSYTLDFQVKVFETGGEWVPSPPDAPELRTDYQTVYYDGTTRLQWEQGYIGSSGPTVRYIVQYGKVGGVCSIDDLQTFQHPDCTTQIYQESADDKYITKNVPVIGDPGQYRFVLYAENDQHQVSPPSDIFTTQPWDSVTAVSFNEVNGVVNLTWSLSGSYYSQPSSFRVNYGEAGGPCTATEVVKYNSGSCSVTDIDLNCFTDEYGNRNCEWRNGDLLQGLENGKTYNIAVGVNAFTGQVMSSAFTAAPQAVKEGAVEIHLDADLDADGQPLDPSAGVPSTVSFDTTSGIMNGDDFRDLPELDFANTPTSGFVVGAERYEFTDGYPTATATQLNMETLDPTDPTYGEVSIENYGWSETVPLGFQTALYGKAVDSLRITDNGYVLLNTAESSDKYTYPYTSFNYGYPLSGGNSGQFWYWPADSSLQDDGQLWYPDSVRAYFLLVAGKWNDLSPGENGVPFGKIKYQVFGEAPYRYMVVHYENVPYNLANGQNGAPYQGTNFQIKIYESQITCIDEDGDGYNTDLPGCGPVDCNDNDPTINPGAEEICDNIDNNCSGKVDEFCPAVYKEDALELMERADLAGVSSQDVNRWNDAKLDIKQSLGNRIYGGDEHIIWFDSDEVDCKHGHKIFDHEKQAVNKLQDIESTSLATTTEQIMSWIVEADRILAEKALASMEEGKQKDKSQATYDGAPYEKDAKHTIQAYRDVWKKANKQCEGTPQSCIDEIELVSPDGTDTVSAIGDLVQKYDTYFVTADETVFSVRTSCQICLRVGQTLANGWIITKLVERPGYEGTIESICPVETTTTSETDSTTDTTDTDSTTDASTTTDSTTDTDST